MIHVPHPSEIVIQSDMGSGNMGDTGDWDSKARFWLNVERCYTVAFIRGTFIGGSGSANCLIKMDSRLVRPGVDAYSAGTATGSVLATPFDHVIKTLTAVGTDTKPIMVRPEWDEYPIYTFCRNRETDVFDVLVLEWPNPNTQQWAVEVGLWDTSRILG